MNVFNAVTNPVRMGLANLANRLCGCSHGRTTFPITLQARTYVACLECGRHLPYDWSRMRIASWQPVGAAPTLFRAVGETGRRAR